MRGWREAFCRKAVGIGGLMIAAVPPVCGGTGVQSCFVRWAYRFTDFDAIDVSDLLQELGRQWKQHGIGSSTYHTAVAGYS